MCLQLKAVLTLFLIEQFYILQWFLWQFWDFQKQISTLTQVPFMLCFVYITSLDIWSCWYMKENFTYYPNIPLMVFLGGRSLIIITVTVNQIAPISQQFPVCKMKNGNNHSECNKLVYFYYNNKIQPFTSHICTDQCIHYNLYQNAVYFPCLFYSSFTIFLPIWV
jgi:hypothetical protein